MAVRAKYATHISDMFGFVIDKWPNVYAGVLYNTLSNHSINYLHIFPLLFRMAHARLA